MILWVTVFLVINVIPTSTRFVKNDKFEEDVSDVQKQEESGKYILCEFQNVQSFICL